MKRTRSHIPHDRRAPRARHPRGERAVAWITLFAFFVSPATLFMSPATAFADTTTTAIGDATTGDGDFVENTETRTTFDQNTKNAVIRWDVMDQQANNTLTFQQQQGESVLNQASGIRMSVFRGMVKCEASCVFANEAGITFADGSYLDVGRLVAVGGNVDEEAFRAGDLHATDLSGTVQNIGVIRANDALLVGARVLNSGEIIIEDGTLTAVVGDEIWLRNHDSNVVVHADLSGTGGAANDPAGFGGDPAIENTGDINAGSGSVRMLAGDMLSFAIRNTGRIRAREIRLEAGEGGLVEVAGSALLDASNTAEGESGGTIDVLGDYVAITDEAVLDASGDGGGGRIQVGGARGGAGSTRTAKHAYVGRGTTLRADATGDGDGGEVIVWSDGNTRSHGTISAQGGWLGGDGGFVETSGRAFLDVTASPLVSARSGNAEDTGGNWLLDPFDIDIVPAGSCTGGCDLDNQLEESASYDPNVVFSPTIRPDDDSAVSEIAVDLLKQALIGGANVTLTTSGSGDDEGSQPGDIELLTGADLTFDDDDGVLTHTEVTLTLLAANDVVINAEVRNEASNLELNLDFRANAEGQTELETGDDELAREYFGDLTLNEDLQTGGGSINLTGTNVDLEADITTAGGSVTVLAEGGDATLGDGTTINTEHSDSERTGGGVLVGAFARVAEDPADEDADPVRGGDIHGHENSTITTAGGSVVVSAGDRSIARRNDGVGGNLYYDGTITSGTGNVVLDAVRAFERIDGRDHEYGGILEFGSTGEILTARANVALSSFVDSASNERSDQMTRVAVLGDIDTHAGAADAELAGGDVEIRSDGFQFASLKIGDSDASDEPVIQTNGGDVSIGSGNSIDLLEGTLDARHADQPTVDDDDVSGDVAISSRGRISIRPEGDDITIGADDTLLISAGADGLANLRIDNTDSESTGNVTFAADSIDLRAGDGLGGQKISQVDLSNTGAGFTLEDRDGGTDSLELRIVQDGNLDVADIPSLTVENLTLQSRDGEIDFGGLDVSATDTITLSAREDITASTPIALPAAPDTLEIEVYDGFTVDSDLASAIDDADARVVELTAGALGSLRNDDSAAEADLIIAADLDLADGGETSETEALVLHAGAGGRGDLSFEGTPTLSAHDITLWAGDGSTASNDAAVVAIEDGTGTVNFDFGSASDPAFTLRQAASIEADAIPEASQFADGDVDGVRYTLRSDGGSIGGDDAIEISKLENSFLTLHARDGIDTLFANGALDATLSVRGLDIGGTASFVYTRTHNDAFVLDNDGGDVALTIRAGLSGSGILAFDGTPEEGDDSDFEIVADEIRLVAGDGLSGGVSAAVLLDRDAEHKPVFKGPGDTPVDLFVFRQDAPIDGNDIAPTDEFFVDVAPDVHVIHSDYESAADPNSTLAAILLSAGDNVPTATSKLILSGESVLVQAQDEEDLELWSLFSDTTPTDGDPFELEIRADTVDLRAVDLNDIAEPIEIVLDPDTGDDPDTDEIILTVTDFEREQTDDEAAAFAPLPFDPDTTPATVPNTVSIFQEADVTAELLASVRHALNNSDLTEHDDTEDEPDEDPTDFFVESVEGDIYLDPTSVSGSNLRLTLRAEGATVDWDRSAGSYDFESLAIGADHSFVFGSGSDTVTGLDITVETLTQLNAGAAGSDGDLSFEPNVTITTNGVVMRAGLDGALAEDGETPAVDLTTNAPTFVLLKSEDADETDTIFEVRQDAGFVDDPALAENGESLIIDPSQIDGASDDIGVIRLVSEAGSITVSNLSTTFEGINDPGDGPVSRLELQAGTVDVLRGGVVTLADEAGGDTNLTYYDSADFAAREIILLADGDDSVIADDPDVLFRPVATSEGAGLRFRIEHERADISECAGDCGSGEIASIDQFVGSSESRPVDYELVSRLGGVEITDEIANKLTGGTNSAPNLVNLYVNANDVDSDVDVVISAQRTGRAIDAQFRSLVIGEVNDEARIRLSDEAGDELVISTTKDQIFYGDVEVDGEVTLTGDTLDFNGDITASDEADLTLNVREEAAFGGDIDLVRDASGPDSVLRVNLDPSASELARVSFDAHGEDQTVRADRVEFFGTREADLDEDTGFVPDNARRSPTATIGKRSGDLSFEVASFRMAEGEKMSVGGALSIGDVGTTYAALGDLSAVTIDVVADTIVLLLRKAGEYIGFDGQVRKDAGVDYVANTISLDGEIELEGSGRAPSFGVSDPFAPNDELEGFIVAEIEPGGGEIRAEDFDRTFNGGLPDLHPEGATRDDYTSIYDARLYDPGVVTAFATHLGDAPLSVQDALLSNIDIALETDRPEAVLARIEGAGIVDDVGGDLPSRADRRVRVSTSRILARDAREVSDRYLRLFGKDEEKADAVREVLQSALDDYLTDSGARRVLGFEFRRYLRNRPSSQFDAYLALEDLDALFSYHRKLGLTPGEYSRIQLRWLATIKPEGISLEQFAEAVHPSRFVRGSDILDVFGD
ncbi:MAG: hypothetical protein QF570_08320 [Myxococcota bacterium]|jgi:filamentous hemagglutinin family protein|nr:hypothetical protein [Myxococcota bacterium]